MCVSEPAGKINSWPGTVNELSCSKSCRARLRIPTAVSEPPSPEPLAFDRTSPSWASHLAVSANASRIRLTTASSLAAPLLGFCEMFPMSAETTESRSASGCLLAAVAVSSEEPPPCLSGPTTGDISRRSAGCLHRGSLKKVSPASVACAASELLNAGDPSTWSVSLCDHLSSWRAATAARLNFGASRSIAKQHQVSSGCNYSGRQRTCNDSGQRRPESATRARKDTFQQYTLRKQKDHTRVTLAGAGRGLE